METASAFVHLEEQRRRVEHDLALGEWARARKRVGSVLEELIATPDGGELQSWLRVLGCLADVPREAAPDNQLKLWPDAHSRGTGEADRVGRMAIGAGTRMGVITRDPAMLEALALLESLADTDLPVLLEGESGTGKEVVARAVHRQSRYGKAAFVAVNCGALPGELHESELFGHARGAYTGAALDKPGLFEAAHGGTIFLDEIGEMDARAQVKLLRTLESGELRRLGEVRTRQVKVRVIAATNLCVDQALAAGRFRKDLLHRLAAIRMLLPPLRERRGDILSLAGHFLRRAVPCPPSLTPAAQMALLRHGWPGNVRELKYTMERAAILWARSGAAELSEEFLLLDGWRFRRQGSAGALLRGAGGNGNGERPAHVGGSSGPVAADAAIPGPANAGQATAGHPNADQAIAGHPSAHHANVGQAGASGVLPAQAGEEGMVSKDGVPGRGAPEGRGWPIEVPAGHTIDTLLAEIERGLIERALQCAGGNRTVAARFLGGISRTTLIGKMKRLGLFVVPDSARARAVAPRDA
ncbi:MAG: sigma 54-interacting transcriptional regulator [Candidatus Eisenbacteria bacterium]